MYKFKNSITKEAFQRYVEFKKMEINKVKPYIWHLRNKDGKELEIRYRDINEWSIQSINDTPFLIYMYFEGNEITISEAWVKGRHLQAPRMLKKFDITAICVQCCVWYGYIIL